MASTPKAQTQKHTSDLKISAHKTQKKTWLKEKVGATKAVCSKNSFLSTFLHFSLVVISYLNTLQ
jgi:hypothetical protein